MERLTEREREVLTLIARGKMGLRDRTQAVVAAYDLGIVRPRNVDPTAQVLLAWA